MRSGFERTLAADLKRDKVPFEYEPCDIPYVINHNYRPDFKLPNGVYIEAKGYFRTAAEIAKYRAVKAQHPDLDIRFVFMDENKKIPGQKTTHGQWAKRHGFPYASGKIPKEWYA
jgi:Autographiviridae endonuclease I